MDKLDMKLYLNLGDFFEDLDKNLTFKIDYDSMRSINFDFWVVSHRITYNLYYPLKDRIIDETRV